MNYFGQTEFQDFSICFALGIVFAVIIGIGFWAVRVVAMRIHSVAFQKALNIMIFLIGFCTQFAIANVIGNTKNVRDENSILGFVAAVGVMAVIAYIFREHFKNRGKEN